MKTKKQIYFAKYYVENRDKLKAYSAKYYKKHREKIKLYRERLARNGRG